MYSYCNSKSLTAFILLHSLCFASLLSACSPQQGEPHEEVQMPSPDLSRLPATLRRRLSEGEERIKVLKTQQAKLQAQVTQLEKLEAKYQADLQSSPQLLQDVEARVSEAHQNLELLDRSLAEMTSLVERIKLQALADEMQVDRDDDQKLKTMLSNAAEVYDEESALTTLQQEAELGKADAQFKLGQRFEKGKGVEQSDVEALSWYLKAAEQGHEQAYLAAGYFYRRGKGTKSDLEKAKLYYKKAADLGNLIAANNLALIYLSGSFEKATPDGVKQAKPWLVMAASGGSSKAQLELAKYYLAQAKTEDHQQAKAYQKAQKLLKRASRARQKSIREQAKVLLSEKLEALETELVKQAQTQLKWVSLPAGEFLMGDLKGGDDAKVTRTVQVKAFQMLANEVTVKEYQSCVLAGHCKPVSLDKKGCYFKKGQNSQQPMNCASWQEAQDFAHWLGGELPSEAQWEYAARSAGQYARYPWGDHEASCERAIMRKSKTKGCGKSQAWPVCSKSSGMSQQGLCDMIGNLWEWTLDEYRPNYNDKLTDDSPVCIDQACTARPNLERVIRGGGYMTKASGATATMRSKSNRAATGIGFRVVKVTK